MHSLGYEGGFGRPKVLLARTDHSEDASGVDKRSFAG